MNDIAFRAGMSALSDSVMDHQINGLGTCFPNHSWEVPSFYTDFAFPYMGWMAFLQAYWAAAGSI